MKSCHQAHRVDEKSVELCAIIGGHATKDVLAKFYSTVKMFNGRHKKSPENMVHRMMGEIIEKRQEQSSQGCDSL